MNLTDKLSDEVLQRRVFNPYYYDLHTKEFLIGKTKDYIPKDSYVLDIGAGVGQYTRWFAKHLILYLHLKLYLQSTIN